MTNDAQKQPNPGPPTATPTPFSLGSGRVRERFCIHSYAGESGPPCGWRGPESLAPRDATGTLHCPRCGRATLLLIPDAPR